MATSVSSVPTNAARAARLPRRDVEGAAPGRRRSALSAATTSARHWRPSIPDSIEEAQGSTDFTEGGGRRQQIHRRNGETEERTEKNCARPAAAAKRPSGEGHAADEPMTASEDLRGLGFVDRMAFCAAPPRRRSRPAGVVRSTAGAGGGGTFFSVPLVNPLPPSPSVSVSSVSSRSFQGREELAVTAPASAPPVSSLKASSSVAAPVTRVSSAALPSAILRPLSMITMREQMRSTTSRMCEQNRIVRPCAASCLQQLLDQHRGDWRRARRAARRGTARRACAAAPRQRPPSASCPSTTRRGACRERRPARTARSSSSRARAAATASRWCRQPTSSSYSSATSVS